MAHSILSVALMLSLRMSFYLMISGAVAMKLSAERLFQYLFDDLFFDSIHNDVDRQYRAADSTDHFTLESRTFRERCDAEEEMTFLIGVDQPLDVTDQSAPVFLETDGTFGKQESDSRTQLDCGNRVIEGQLPLACTRGGICVSIAA
jgi:hypothetical protein